MQQRPIRFGCADMVLASILALISICIGHLLIKQLAGDAFLFYLIGATLLTVIVVFIKAHS